ncbi:MAG: leucine-rich repeat domain-containing protein [Pirellulaceae bacterium]
MVRSQLSHLLVLLLGAAALAGCREGSIPRLTPQEPVEKPGVDAGDVVQPTEPVTLTERQAQAFHRIVAAGGSMERADNGAPVALDLASERVFADDALIRDALEFPHLKQLRLAVSKAAPESVAELSRLSELEDLFLQDAPLNDSALATLLRALPQLRRLTLRRLSQVTDRALESLPDCKRLDAVALIEMSGITGRTLQTLQQVPQLRLLDVRNCGQLTTSDFSFLSALRSLEELKLGGPAINDEVLVLVAQHPLLSALSLDDAQVSSACLQRLADSHDMANRLKSISFTRCFGVTDESLHPLRAFANLDSLALRDIMLTGTFLQFVHDAADEPLPLKSLRITDAFLTDEALTPLPAMFSALTRIDLSGNQGLTDATLDILKQIRTLKEVRLERTAVTRKWYPVGD